MKKQFIKLLALTSAVVMAFPLFSSCKKNEEVKAASHVAIDVNPSLSLSLDEDNKVITVHASNEDAQILLYGEHLKGLDLEVALEKIAELSVELDYVNADNHGINVSVSGKLGENDVIGKLEAAFDKEAGALDINFSSDGTFTDLRILEGIKADFSANVDVQNLTVTEYKLIAEAQAVDGALSIEEAVKMSQEELMQIIAEGAIAIEPYATKAYNTAVSAASRVYNELKGGLLDVIWMEPYVKDLVNIFNRKYEVNNGALYNMYAGSSRVLGVAIDGIEAMIEIKNNTQVPTVVLDNIATALNLTEEQKTAFIAEVTVDGKITINSVESYLNKWFKNLTAEQRAQLKTTVDAIIDDVQAFAVTIDNSIAEEYKAAVVKLVKDLNDLIPDGLKTIAGAYVAEFENLVNKISTAVDGKEPLPAIKAVKKAFDGEATRLMQTMKEELTKEDLASVESAIEKVSGTLEGYEKSFADAKAKAEAEAKAWLENAKANRKNA